MNKIITIICLLFLVFGIKTTINTQTQSKVIYINSLFDKGRSITNAPNPYSTKLIEHKNRKLIETYRLRYKNFGKMNPKSIILHISHNKSLLESIFRMEQIQFAVHIAIDYEGRAYQLMDSLKDKGRAAKDMDDTSIHILLIGKNESEILNNTAQKQKAVEVIKSICKIYNIPINNFDIEARKGIFAHYQSKYKFGGFVQLDKGLNQEGARYVRDVIWMINKKKEGYYPETQWKNRSKGNWVYPYHKPKSTIKSKKSNKGRGISPTPKAELESVQQDKNGYLIEEMRIKYVYKKDIKITGITLHYSYSENIYSTLDWFDKVTCCSQLIVNKDGKAYQVMDKLKHRAASTYGTNSNCIQIEIIGMGERDLLNNVEQKKKVIQLVKELVIKYNIPKNNYDIESGKGIFSHGQAKKRWGHSQWLYGIGFDPGEEYMKEVIEGIGGIYYSDAIEYENFNFPKLILLNFYNKDPWINILSYILKENNLKIFKDINWKDRFKKKWVFYPFKWIP